MKNALELYVFEAELAAGKRFCGTDEAGAGPLAGPVVAAAVILDASRPIEGLNDSKQVKEEDREAMFVRIQAEAIAFAIAESTVSEIDSINILQASLLAMRRAVLALQVKPELVLVDARFIPGLGIEQRGIVKGDARCASIAAASILAKVHRDRLMRTLDGKFPGYGFSQHKGYGCATHLEALRVLGPSPEHRRSFAPVRDALGLAPAQQSLF